MSHTPPRQPAYDAVFDVIRRIPPRSATGYEQTAENARVWRAVEAALDAMEPAPHLLPLLNLTADEADALADLSRRLTADAGWISPVLRSALNKLTTTDTTEEG